MQTLSGRLALAASFVRPGASVCDVGTDHGYLPLCLYKSGRCKSVCCTEINEKPYKNAEKTFALNGCDIRLCLCDGLSAFTEADGIDTVIITGMGGDVISGIIERAPFLYKGGVSLILQPMTAAGELRRFLAKSGFAVTREQAVTDAGRIYSVMLAEYTGAPYAIGPARERIGILKPDTPDNIVYIKRQQNLCRELVNRLRPVEDKKDLFEKENNALREITRILG